MGEPTYGQYVVEDASVLVNFRVGQPSPDLLPLDKMRVASAAKFAETEPLFLQYGNIYGYPKFRKSLCEFLTKRYGHEVTDDRIMATNGNTGALSLICSLFTKSGDVVYAEEPTYFLAKAIFKDFKLNCVQIPMDEQGLDVDALEKKLEDPDSPKPVMMYVIPTAHNPVGRTLIESRRAKLAALSIKYKFLLVCDEVYQMLTFPHITPPPPMFTYDKEGTIIAIGSFSKILCPGIRVGFLQASPDILKKIHDCGQLDSSGGMNPVGFGIVEKAIDLGIQDEHVEFVRENLWKRFSALKAAFDKYLPKSCSYEVPQGGYFCVVALPVGYKAADLLPIAMKHKVAFLPGSSFGERMQNFMRISFSYYSPEDITIGVQRLAAAIDEFLSNDASKKVKQ